MLDTNLLISSEDTSPLLNRAVADLAGLAHKHGWQLVVHPASFEDLGMDKDATRRSAVVSRLAKFERLAAS